jgi:UDP-glucose:(heptosyl)LPS alpha-1,3-glucosyltransferase
VKLAIVRQRYNPFGGAERFVARAAEMLAQQGTSLTVVARDWTGAGTQAQWLRCDPLYFGRLWRDWSFARAACAATAAGDFDLVQSHERLPCCDVYRAGDGVHAQWLEYRARTLSHFGRAWLRLNPYHRYVLAAERRLFASPRLRAVICNSRMVRDDVRRWFRVDESKLHIIYNGVDVKEFHPGLCAEHRSTQRTRLEIPEKAAVFLFVGSGFERKGVPQLVEAFRRSRKPDSHLLVVGKDPSLAGFAARARALGLAECVHWLGPQHDVRPWYGAADCLVLPTLYDPFPNVALEAMASGLPVLTTRHCGAAEIVQEGRNGYVCTDPLDIDELAANMTRISTSAAGMRENARDTAKAYDIAIMASALMLLYRDLLAQAGPADALS